MATLYRYYDSDLVLLYAGRTAVGMARSYGHASSADWWSRVAVAEFHYVHETEIAWAEKAVIWFERPLWNRALRLTTQRRAEVHQRLDAVNGRIFPSDVCNALRIWEEDFDLLIEWGFLPEQWTNEDIRTLIGREDSPDPRTVRSRRRDRPIDRRLITRFEPRDPNP